MVALLLLFVTNHRVPKSVFRGKGGVTARNVESRTTAEARSEPVLGSLVPLILDNGGLQRAPEQTASPRVVNGVGVQAWPTRLEDGLAEGTIRRKRKIRTNLKK